MVDWGQGIHWRLWLFETLKTAESIHRDEGDGRDKGISDSKDIGFPPEACGNDRTFPYYNKLPCKGVRKNAPSFPRFPPHIIIPRPFGDRPFIDEKRICHRSIRFSRKRIWFR